MNANPLISVIIPCFNAQQYIGQTLESILNQTFKNFEIIVIDDGSTDQTEKVLNKYNGKIRYIYQENSGPAVARNRGIFESKGEYLAFCDADDMWEKKKLQKQISLFVKYPSLGLCATNGIFIDKNGIEDTRLVSENRKMKSGEDKVQWLGLENFVLNMQIYPSTLMIRKEALKKVGLLFIQNLFPLENVLMEMKLIQSYKAIFLNEILIKRRFLTNSASHNRGKLNRNAQITIFRTALNEYPDYRRVILIRLIHSIYSLARIEFREANFKEARKYLLESIKLNKLLGKNYFKNNESFFAKLKKIITPYVFILITSMPHRLALVLSKFSEKNSNESDIW